MTQVNYVSSIIKILHRKSFVTNFGSLDLFLGTEGLILEKIWANLPQLLVRNRVKRAAIMWKEFIQKLDNSKCNINLAPSGDKY